MKGNPAILVWLDCGKRAGERPRGKQSYLISFVKEFESKMFNLGESILDHP